MNSIIKEQQLPLTKEEFYAEIGKAIKIMPPNWRKGQKVFNAVEQLFGIARIIQFKYRIDCYHDDSQIEAFKEQAFKIYLEYNGNSRTESKGTNRL